MKRILLFLSALFIATTAIAHTINWYVDGSVYHTTTCESGENVTPPTAPEKYGYTFQGWYGYIPIEYLESTGTQAIDTGVVFSHPNSKVIIKFQPISYENSCLSGAEKEVNGSNSSWTFIATLKNTETCIWHAQNTTQNSFCTAVNTSNTYVLEMSQTDGVFTKTINGVSYSKNNIPYYTLNSFALFADNYGNGNYTQKAKARIYYTKIYENNTLVRDFIPVLDKDGTPCMFDKVERKFYYNAGTGDFIAGPIIGE